MAPMDKDTDVDEYLEVFEALMRNLGKTEDLWSSYLQPVMNNVCTTVFTSMPQHKREVYQELKMAILSTCSTGLEQPFGPMNGRKGRPSCKWRGSCPDWGSALP